MQSIKKHLILVVALVFVFALNSSLFAASKARVYMSAQYTTVVDQYRLVELTVREKVDNKFSPLVNLPVEIFLETANGDSLFATINSDNQGYAHLLIDASYPLFVNEKGRSVIKAQFPGSETHKKAKKSIKVKPLTLTADFSDAKEITISALTLNDEGEEAAPEKLTVSVFVTRLIADYKVGDIDMEMGEGKYTFDSDIPGDENGKLEVKLIVKDRKFQQVQIIKELNWGKPLVQEVETDNPAPGSYLIFMILAFLLALSLGVILHKRLSKKEA